jgi:hypothetical protein
MGFHVAAHDPWYCNPFALPKKVLKESPRLNFLSNGDVKQDGLGTSDYIEMEQAASNAER